MTLPSIPARKWWLFAPLAMVLLIIAVACGEDATPTAAPTNTPTPAATTAPTAVPQATATQAPQVATATTAPTESRFFDHLGLAAARGEQPRKGGIFKTGLQENFPHHDYHQGFNSNFAAEGPLYNGLLMTDPYDWTDEVIPDLAYKWEMSPDGLKTTFFLHENVVFHDGSPFSSEDVKYSFERILFKGAVAGNTDTAGGHFWIRILWDAVLEGFEAPDPNTFSVLTKAPSSLVVDIFANGYTKVVSKKQSSPDPINALKEALKIIGTGPQRMAEDASTTMWKMERNPDYFKPGLPYLDGFEAHLILDMTTRATAVLTQKIHMNAPGSLPYLGFDLAQSIASQNDRIVHEGNQGGWPLMFYVNATRAPLDDLRVRQAISEAIDRSQLVISDPVTGIAGLGTQRGTIGTALTPYGKWDMPQSEKDKLIGFGSDMEKRRDNARALLASYEADNGPIDWASLPIHDAYAQHVGSDVAELLASQLKLVGITPWNIKPGEVIAVAQKYIDGEYYTGSSYNPREGDDPIPLFALNWITGGSRNLFGPTAAGLDDLYAKQLNETDFEKRKQIAWEMNRIVMNDAKGVPHFWGIAENIRWDFVKAWSTKPFYWDSMASQEFLWLDLPELPLAE